MDYCSGGQQCYAPHEIKSPDLCNINDTNERKIIAQVITGVVISKKPSIGHIV
jgi:hypothetical protein